MLKTILQAVDPAKVTAETIPTLAAALDSEAPLQARFAKWMTLLPLLNPSAINGQLVNAVLRMMRFDTQGAEALVERVAEAYKSRGVGGVLPHSLEILALPRGGEESSGGIVGLKCPHCNRIYFRNLSK